MEEIIIKALNTAYECHKNETRKGSDFPYYVHILDVAKYLMYETKDKEIICAGILHDTLEDSDYTKEEIITNFGERVFNLVNFCTEPGNTPDASDDEQKTSWKKRKEHSINTLNGADSDELLVFVSDKLANLLSMQEDLINGVDVWTKFNAPKKEIKWYYESILREVEHKLKDTRLFKIFKKRIEEVFE